jgi:chromosome segregation ATPase
MEDRRFSGRDCGIRYRQKFLTLGNFFSVNSMGEEDPLLECVRGALQAQEEIKQELLAQLAVFEKEAQPQQPTVKTMQFYLTTLKHAISDKSAVASQISNYSSSVLPDLENQLARISSRRRGLLEQIQALQKSRNQEWLNEARCPEKVDHLLAQMTGELRTEIAELDTTDMQLKANISKARHDLRVLQEQNRARQTTSAKDSWQSEMADEQQVNRSPKSGRKRAASVVSPEPSAGFRTRRMSIKVVRPDPLRGAAK